MNLSATGFLFWPGNDGLRPYERRRMARAYEKRNRPPTAEERQQKVIDEWRELPNSVRIDLLANAPGFYFATARWAAHFEASVSFSDALVRAGFPSRTRPASVLSGQPEADR